VGVSLQIPVFDGGRLEARRAEAQSAIRQEELRVSQLERKIELEVREALLRLDAARAEAENSGDEIAVARQELEHLTRLHGEGLGGQMDVMEAEVNLARAEDDRSASLYAWGVARIELMQAMGTVATLAQ